MFGSHLSIAGGLQNALDSAKNLHLDCLQIFTKNQRQWSPPPLSAQQINLWRENQKSAGIAPVVSHDSYLINPASPNDDIRQKSITALTDELQRCQVLNIPYLVMHPGAHLGSGEKIGLAKVAAALNQIHEENKNIAVITCLEVTAGQGTTLGYRFEHLRDIVAALREPARVAVCLDTAHLLEAGYDLTSADGCENMLEQLQRVLGLHLVRVIHVNDSKTPRGSRVDRHEHIGKGHVSKQAFSVLLRHKAFAAVPKIMETPKGTAPDGQQWDEINLALLKELAEK